MECKNLGLKTNVLQLERSLAQMSLCISEDNGAIKHFLDEVQRMKNELVSLTRLIVEDQPPLILPYVKVLSDIEASLFSLSIPCDDLSELIPDSTSTNEVSVVSDHAAVDSMELEVDDGEKDAVPSSPVSDVTPTATDALPGVSEGNATSTVSAMPKFNWASKVLSSVPKPEVKSLREIQEEEKNDKSS